jgi:hypothetical protein
MALDGKLSVCITDCNEPDSITTFERDWVYRVEQLILPLKHTGIYVYHLL